MPKIAYVRKRFNLRTLDTIDQANAIIEEYAAQGFALTLRQLYYQFVARDLLPNTLRSYKNLGNVVNDARLAGRIDWDHIQDRTRNLMSIPHYENPQHAIQRARDRYEIDRWEHQEYRPEVWIEKDALVGVIEQVCDKYDVPYFSCRGYTSQSEMWRAAQRLQRHAERGQTPVVFHLGDHDPSGKDMTRDVLDRLQLFMGGVDLHRLALNLDQVHEFKPPPNPAKVTDSRVAAYISEFGHDSWELDALEPRVMSDLIEQHVKGLINEEQWNEDDERWNEQRDLLSAASSRWDKVEKFLKRKE